MSFHVDLRVRRLDGTHVVRAGGAVLGETAQALELSLAGQPPVVFFPEADLAMALLEPGETGAPPAGAGMARYYGISLPAEMLEKAAWGPALATAPGTAPELAPETARLAGHIAFDTARVTVEKI